MAVATDMSDTGIPRIREEVLRDPRNPVCMIADRLLPYLRILVEKFRPERVILFGSYAYGQPDENSDVDLLVIKPLEQSSVQETSAILKAWRPVRWSQPPLPIEVLVETPAGHQARLARSSPFYFDAVNRGLRLV